MIDPRSEHGLAPAHALPRQQQQLDLQLLSPGEPGTERSSEREFEHGPEFGVERPLSPYAERYHWRFDSYHPALEPLLPAAKRFVSDVFHGDVPPYWLTVLGPSGVGKTLLLRQVYRCLSRNEHLWEVPTPTGSRMPQCAHLIPGRDLGDYQAPRDYGRYDLCYVEDIGAGAGLEKGSGAVTASRVAELLQYRTGRWTLLCANLSRRAIAERLDPRIASRLKRDGSVLIELPGEVPDYWER